MSVPAPSKMSQSCQQVDQQALGVIERITKSVLFLTAVCVVVPYRPLKGFWLSFPVNFEKTFKPTNTSLADRFAK